MTDPFSVVRDFEAALCEYTGAPFAVTTSSCTMALLLAVAYHLRPLPSGNKPVVWARPRTIVEIEHWTKQRGERSEIEIPKRTYVSVPMSIIHAGGWPCFRDEDWHGAYQLKPLHVWDYARRFTSGMYKGDRTAIESDRLGAAWERTRITDYAGQMLCVSFHHSKILGDTQGGAILHDNPEADKWLRRARFDGRTEGVAPKDDNLMLGWHAYLSPDVAARLLWKLSKLPLHNDDLPNDDYPDLSLMKCFI